MLEAIFQVHSRNCWHMLDDNAEVWHSSDDETEADKWGMI